MRQLTISFPELPLHEQFPDFIDVVRASVYGCRRYLKDIAAECDMSPSELNRKLADKHEDPVHFPLKKLPLLIRATGDRRPLYWLIEEFCETDESRQARADSEEEQLVQVLLERIRRRRQGAPV